MPSKTERITIWVCSGCGHEWQSKTGEKPLICPRCKRAGWDRPGKPRKK